VIPLSEPTVLCHFTFNVEHNKLLDQLKAKTGKDKRELIREAVQLAISKELAPTEYHWVKKNHRIFDVELPEQDAQKAKKLWKGKLTPFAVSGILAMIQDEGLKKPEVTPEELQTLREGLEKVFQSVQMFDKKLTREEAPKRITDNTAAVKAVKATLYHLVQELEFFKKGTEADRKKFRELIDPMEIGYVTSLLKALFDEEGFQRWILATEFTMGKRNA
jgi:hypothetical protein